MLNINQTFERLERFSGFSKYVYPVQNSGKTKKWKLTKF